MDIRQFIFRQVAKHQVPRVKQYHNYYQAKSVLIIFESDYIERNTLIKDMIVQLKNDGKEVDAWGYVDKKETTTSTISSFRVIGKKDINLFGMPNKNKIADMLIKRYDLLLDLRQQPNVPLQYLTLYANADLKAGADLSDKYKGPQLLDFMVKVEKNEEAEKEQIVQSLFDQLIHYIKIIRQ